MTRIQWLAALTLLTAAPPAPAAEPQVRFKVEDGWVELTLTRDDQPVKDAQVIVLDAEGWRFADGDTGGTGTGVFPVPPGPEFTVEIRIDDQTAEAIRLAPRAGGVFPEAVLLRFPTSPCCRVPTRGTLAQPTPANPVPLSLWVQALVGVAFTTVGLVALLTRFLRSRPTHTDSPRR